MEDKKIESYTISPRSILSDYRNGKLSIPERNLLSWIRLNGNPYGIAFVDLNLLSRETFNEPVSKSYINRLISSLKRKKYIWYKERPGRRGSFEVHIDLWILPSKDISRITKYFEQRLVRGEDHIQTPTQSEVSPQLESQSQRLETPKKATDITDSENSKTEADRGSDNDTETKNDNENELCNSLSNKGRDYSVAGFKATSKEEKRCLRFAKRVGDQSVAYYISIYKKHGFEPLNLASKEFVKAKGDEKENPPAFFNYLVQQFL